MPAPSVLRQPSRAFLATAAALPLALAVLADDVRVRRQLRAARRDPLTGLATRDALTSRITHLAARSELLHVLVADADGLKTVNDTLGHAAGDLLIAAIGHRIGAWAKAHDGLAVRLGGDEFGVVVLLQPADTARGVRALREHLAQPVDCGPESLRPAVSIGVARAADLPGAADPSRLLRGADMAMYKVKTGSEAFPYLATRADAHADSVNGRRAGRPGTAAQERAA